MLLLRNLAFYVAFYSGSLLITSAALLALPTGVERFRRWVRAWSRWQRWCLRHLLGCSIAVEGIVRVRIGGDPDVAAPRGIAFFSEHGVFVAEAARGVLLECKGGKTRVVAGGFAKSARAIRT